MAVQPTDNRPCVFFSMGVGGLDDNHSVITSYGVDFVFVIDSPVSSFCGLNSLTPVVFNGYTITIDASKDWCWHRYALW